MTYLEADSVQEAPRTPMDQQTGGIFEDALFLLGTARLQGNGNTKTHVIFEPELPAKTAFIILTCSRAEDGGIKIEAWGTKGTENPQDGKINYGTLMFDTNGVLQAGNQLQLKVGVELIKNALSSQRARVEQIMDGTNFDVSSK